MLGAPFCGFLLIFFVRRVRTAYIGNFVFECREMSSAWPLLFQASACYQPRPSKDGFRNLTLAV
jgi:hypothetical protein